MKLYTVVYAQEARDDLRNLFHYIAEASGNDYVSAQFVASITHFCDGLDIFPVRGIQRDDIRPGLRITNHAGSTIIAFTVDDDILRVEILGVFYGGQDYAARLSNS